MSELTLEQRRGERRARVAAAATIPSFQHRPATAPVPQKEPVWEPDDPVFYHRAVCTIAAALRPPTLADDDKTKADALAKTIAKALCGGGFPESYMTLRNHMVLTHQINVADELAQAERAGSRNVMSEGEKTKRRAQLEKYASLGPIPTRAELIEINKADLADLSHLSEGVRAAALDAICLNLCQRPDITGARQDDAFNVVVDAIEHSLSVAESLGLPTGEPSDDEVFGPSRFPYPASLAIEYLASAAANAQDDDGPVSEEKQE